MAFIHVSPDMTAGDLVVGLGTLALASFTYLLARRTGEEAQLTEENLALSREAIEAQERPFLIATPDEQHRLLGFRKDLPDHPNWRFVYRLWNIGKGPAIVEALSLVDAGGHEYLEPIADERTVAINPPVHDNLGVLHEDRPPSAGAKLALRIAYRSASEERYTTVSQLQVTDDLSCICTDFRRETSERRG